MLAISPTLPSFYIDNRILNGNDYDFNCFTLDKSININWLNQKPERSVIYVPFIGMACLGNKQVNELVWDLKKSSFYLLWIIRYYKGLIVNWSPQLEVLSNKDAGCQFGTPKLLVFKTFYFN